MDPQVDLHEDRRSRAAAAAEIVASTLERGVPHLALAAAREAARSALLELGRGPRRLAARDLALLQELAAAPPQHLAGRPAERQALLRAALSILDRVFLQPPGARRRAPPQGGDAGQPSPRKPDHAHPLPRGSWGSVGVAPSDLVARRSRPGGPAPSRTPPPDRGGPPPWA